MFSGYGWCVLRSSREFYRSAAISDVDAIDDAVDAADRELWAAFSDWCAANPHPMFRTYFHETINFQNGILMFCISRNHRSAPVWDMLQWIATNGPGSYGLFYAQDDEDSHDVDHDPKRYSRFEPPVNYDFTNVFRVHRIANGTVTEMEDPFFGPISPNIDPPHPYDEDD